MERRTRTRKKLTKDQLLGVANFITYGRIILVPVIVLLLMGINDFDPRRLAVNKLYSWLAMIIFTVASLSDIVDGYYARKYQVISSFGKFLDPLADKLLSLPTLVMMIPLQRVAAWVVVVLLVREVTVTALRGVAAAEGIEIAASDWGKKKTLLLSFAIGALALHYSFFGLNAQRIGTTLLWLAVPVSLGSGLHYTYAFFSTVVARQKTH